MKKQKRNAVRFVPAFCILVSLVAVFISIYNAVFAAETSQAEAGESLIRTVPLGKASHFAPNGSYRVTVVGTWEDGSTNRPAISLTATTKPEHEAVAIEMEAWLATAINKDLSIRFTVDKTPTPHLNSFVFYKVSVQNVTFDLRTGTVTEKATSLAVNVPARAASGKSRPIDVRVPEVYVNPKTLDDYTIQLGVHWGVENSGSYITLFHDSHNWKVTGAEQVDATCIRLFLNNNREAKINTLLLYFEKEVHPECIWVHGGRSRWVLEPLLATLTENTLKGSVRPAMLKSLLATARKN